MTLGLLDDVNSDTAQALNHASNHNRLHSRFNEQFSLSDTDFGADRTGVADSTAALNLAIAGYNASTEGDLVIPKGTYLISSILTSPTRAGVIDWSQATIKFASPFTGTDMGAWVLLGDDITMYQGAYDYSAAPLLKSNRYGVWVAGSNCRLLGGRATGLVLGGLGTGIESAVILASGSNNSVEGFRTSNCPGTVYIQSSYSTAERCFALNPTDSPYAINGITNVGSSLLYCRAVGDGVRAPGGTFVVEEGASKATLIGNRAFNCNHQYGLAFVNVTEFTMSRGNVVVDNIIDFQGLSTTAAQYGFYSDAFYSTAWANNEVHNLSAASVGSSAIWLPLSDNLWFGGRVVAGSAAANQNQAVYVLPGNGGTLLIDGLDIDGDSSINRGIAFVVGPYDWDPGAGTQNKDYAATDLVTIRDVKYRKLAVGLYTLDLAGFNKPIIEHENPQFYTISNANEQLASGSYRREYIQSVEVQLTNAQILALRATPITLFAAPGALQTIVIDKVLASVNSGAGAFVESAANFEIEYTTGPASIMIMETTGWIDAVGQFPRVQVPAYTSTYTPIVNSAIRVKNNGAGEITGGGVGDTLTFRIDYRIVPTYFN